MVIPFLQVLCRLDHRHLSFSILVTVALGVLAMLAGISVSGEILKEDIGKKTRQTGERTCASYNHQWPAGIQAPTSRYCKILVLFLSWQPVSARGFNPLASLFLVSRGSALVLQPCADLGPVLLQPQILRK